MTCGIIAMAGGFFPKYSILFILVPILSSALFLLIYSFLLHRRVTNEGLGVADEMKIEKGSGDTKWDNIKEGYLYQVEKMLLKVKHHAKKQVLEDVSSHLDQKYAELSEDNRTWENYQQIITEMGPAEDYAELLDGESMQPSRQPSSLFVKYLKIFALIAIFFGVVCWWLGILEFGRLEDNIDYPFSDDPEVIGVWKSVDFVGSINDFVPGQKRWVHNLFLHELAFKENGTLVAKNDKVPNGYSLKWTKGIIISSHEKTASKYHIKEMDGNKYMFYEWKSGDYVIRHQKPSYYVLKKVKNNITGKMPESESTYISDSSIEQGIQSAYEWLSLIDDNQYAESWHQAASFFKERVSQQQWEEAIENINKPLGKVINRKVISKLPTKTLPGVPDGDYVVIQFKTSFENKRDAIETITPMLEKDGKWRVSGYFIK